MKPQRVRGIIEHQGKFLLVRNNGSASFWCLPGGKVDDNEDIVSALHREIVEETGIEPVIGALMYVHQFKTNDALGLPEFYFQITNGADYANLDITTSTHGQLELAEIAFVDLQALQADIRPAFLQRELPALVGARFNEVARIRFEDSSATLDA